MSGFSEIRLYQNTTSSIPVGVYTDVTADVIGSAMPMSLGPTLYDYDNAIKTVTGLAPGTQYWFWIELIDAEGNSGGIQPLGSHTTTAAVSDDVWLFYSAGAVGASGYHCINQFYYSGSAGTGGTYSLNYAHVTLYDVGEEKGVLPENGDGSVSDTPVNQAGASSASVMNSTSESGFSQLVWGPGSPSAPLLAFSIRIPAGNTTQIPETGWQWTQRAIRGDQLGSWRIWRNGVELSHNATTNPGGSSEASRNIAPI